MSTQNTGTEAAQQLDADLHRLVDFLRHLPPEHRAAYCEVVKRVATGVTTKSLNDLADSNLMLEQYRRVKLSSDTFFGIIVKMMGATNGTSAAEAIMPHVLELQRFLKELDAPAPTDADARALAETQIAALLAKQKP